MAVASSRRSRAVNVSREAVDQVGVLLQQLPEKPKEAVSLQEAVNQLQEEIRLALSKGYSYAELAPLLGERGIAISANTLKRYVSIGRGKSGKGRKPSTNGRRKKATPAEESEAVSSEAAPAETAEPEAPKPEGRRGRGKAKAEPTAEAAPEAPPKATRGRRASSAAKSAGTTRTTSRRRK
ncbi:hypothetical protein IFO70_04415 [Phormidium tenue FACHB-886]|nr:hypothetical protein [Phormidium tenue FACHB-886]